MLGVNYLCMWASLIGSVLVSLVILVIGVAVIVHKKRATGQYTTEEKEAIFQAGKPTDTLNDAPCLFLHPRLPLWIRYAMPLFICLNVALFCIANTSGGCTVYMTFTTGLGQVIQSQPLYIFDLANSVHVTFKK